MEHTISKKDIYNDIKNLPDVLNLYKIHLIFTHGELKGSTDFAQTLTAIRRYTLPGMGHPAPVGRRPTQKEEEAADKFLKTIDLSQLNQLMDYQKRGFELMKAGKSQQAYKSRLKALLTWAKTQPWFPAPIQNNGRRNYCPPTRHGFGNTRDKRTTGKPKPSSYALKAVSKEEIQQAKEFRENPNPNQEQKAFVTEVITKLKIDKEISGLLEYWFKEHYSGRLEKAKKKTMKECVEGGVRRLLGWRYGGVKNQLLADLIEKEKTKRRKANPKDQAAFGGWGEDLDLLDEFDESDESDKFDEAEFLAGIGSEVLRQIHLDALKQTNLEALVPHPDTEGFTPETAKDHVDQMICAALKFMKEERNSESPYTWDQTVDAFEKIARLHWHAKAEDPMYRNVKVMEPIRRHRNQLSLEAENHISVADIDLKWLEMPEVLEKVVKPLRLHCGYRLHCGTLRPITAIAHSFQVFNVYGCLTFTPPRRQQEWREAKLVNSCLLTDKPKDLQPGQFIHPLPPNRWDETEKYFPYIHREKDGTWRLHHTPDSYKTGKTYGKQNIEILNPQFEDGRCFYDYIEAFIYGYYRNRDGDWHSGGEWTEAPSNSWRLFSLRMAFEPKGVLEQKKDSQGDCSLVQPTHFFLQLKTGNHHVSNSDFGAIFRHAANRLTGKLLTPHLLRDIYATWFLKQEDTPERKGSFSERIASLAYAMGHSEEELRKTYDKRKAEEKRRAAEEAMKEILAEYVT